VVRRLLNRLIGRTGPSIDAINAYVEGKASEGEMKLVESMMRDNPALENDLATQKALLGVLDRVEKVEVPRSFAITPEMVSAASGAESSLSKLAELFAPRRKMAMAPAILAGFAALTVALLTVGDIAGVVEQSEQRESFSADSLVVTESAAPVAGGATLAKAPDGDTGVGEPEFEMAVEEEASAGAGTNGSTEPQVQELAEAPRAEGALAAAEPEGPEAAVVEAAPMLESSMAGDDADMAEPPSLPAEAPAPIAATAGAPTDGLAVAPAGELEDRAGDEATKRELDDSADTADSGGREDPATTLQAGSPQAGSADESASVRVEPEIAFLDRPTDDRSDGIALPLWQLQLVFAALTVIVIGAWAGLRRIRRD
jgi:hypothetical protein